MTTMPDIDMRRASRPWSSGLFWKYALGVLAISYVSTMLLIFAELASHGERLRRAFASGEVAAMLAAQTADLAPELPHAAARAATCHALLEATLYRLISAGGALHNPYGEAIVAPTRAGWLIAWRDGDRGCRWPDDTIEALNTAVDRYERDRAMPDVDIDLAAIELPAGGTLTLALRRASLGDAFAYVHNFEGAAMFVYLSIISVVCALALALLFVRRIRRAERAADAWAAGQLDARIDERGRDEFARLAQRFDRMADALSEHIGVKQALAAADERNRLARDLHDSAKQRCFALGLQLSVLRHRAPPDPALIGLVDAVLALATRLQSDLDDVIRRVGAPAIAEAGLRRTLEHGIDLLLRDSGIGWTLALDDADEATLSRHASLTAQLLLVVNEAVANALRHSRAQTLAVTVSHSAGRWHCVVADDGCGFDAATARIGMGLSNMRARAAAMPLGRVDIETAPGRGTRVVISFVLEKRLPDKGTHA